MQRGIALQTSRACPFVADLLEAVPTISTGSRSRSFGNRGIAGDVLVEGQHTSDILRVPVCGRPPSDSSRDADRVLFPLQIFRQRENGRENPWGGVLHFTITTGLCSNRKEMD